MKHENAPSQFYIPQPFASGDLSTTAALTPIQEARDSNAVNFVDGFPAAYSAPSQNNGRFILRGQMNALGNLASANQFFRACGGVYQFDQRLANKIGGYPRYAVLEYLDGANYYRVISLVDDNMVDYTGAVINSDIPNNQCVSGSVDGINWAYCERGIVDESDVVCKLPNFKFLEGGSEGFDLFPIGQFKARRSGILTFQGSFDIESIAKTTYSKIVTNNSPSIEGEPNGTQERTTTEVSTTPRTITTSGLLLLALEDSESNPTQELATVIYSRGSGGITVNNFNYNNQSIRTMPILSGSEYSIFCLAQNVNVSNSEFEIRIS